MIIKIFCWEILLYAPQIHVWRKLFDWKRKAEEGYIYGAVSDLYSKHKGRLSIGDCMDRVEKYMNRNKGKR